MTFQTPRFFQEGIVTPNKSRQQNFNPIFKNLLMEFLDLFNSVIPHFLLGGRKFQNDIRNRHQVHQFDPPYTSSIRVTIPSPCNCLASAAASAACRKESMDPAARDCQFFIEYPIAFLNIEVFIATKARFVKFYTSATISSPLVLIIYMGVSKNTTKWMDLYWKSLFFIG